MAALAEVYQMAGHADRAGAQKTLIQAVDRIYRANGVNTDLQIALFYADHDLNLGEALTMARGAYEAAPGVYAADALAWVLLKNGRIAEAQTLSAEALRYGTPEAAFHYHAALIGLAAGDRSGAARQVDAALRINPHFSVLHAGEAKALQVELKGSAGR